ERVLFLGIVGALVIASASTTIVVRSFRLSTQLRKIVEMNRLTGYSPELALNRIGEVGQAIVTLYGQLNEMSEKKSLKISALTALNEYLLAASDELIAVTDASGTIVQASRPLFQRLGERPQGVIGAHLDSLVPGAQTGSAVIEMNRTRTQVVRERRGDSIVFTPVINRAGDVAYAVVTLTRHVTDEMRERTATAHRTTRSVRAPGTRRTPLLSRLFARR
ncbi:MAG: hypothetical protein ACOC1U_09590, partial [Spirochaetota bacterium]